MYVQFSKLNGIIDVLVIRERKGLVVSPASLRAAGIEKVVSKGGGPVGPTRGGGGEEKFKEGASKFPHALCSQVYRPVSAGGDRWESRSEYSRKRSRESGEKNRRDDSSGGSGRIRCLGQCGGRASERVSDAGRYKVGERGDRSG